MERERQRENIVANRRNKVMVKFARSRSNIFRVGPVSAHHLHVLSRGPRDNRHLRAHSSAQRRVLVQMRSEIYGFPELRPIN